MDTLEKGSHKPLNVTKEAKHRVFVGLSWDPKKGTFGLIDQISMVIKRRIKGHDLDLACFIYDANNTLISTVDVNSVNATDESGKIYHSGDNIDGSGGGDDEQISVELKKITPNITNIIFVATIKNGNTFDEIKVPAIRLVDGYSNREFITASLDGEDAAGKSGYAFIRLYPNDDGWSVHSIGEFFDAKAEENVSEFLKTYLD